MPHWPGSESAVGPGSKPTDIVAALRKSPADRKLWGELYRRLWPAVYYTLFKLTGGQPETARDLAHDTFLAFMRKADVGLIPDEAHATAYLRQMARRNFLNFRRTAAKVVDTTTEEGERALASAVYDEEDLKHLVWDLERLISGLDIAERRLLAALVLGSTLHEIAVREGLSDGAAAVRVSRLRRKISLTSYGYKKAGNESPT